MELGSDDYQYFGRETSDSLKRLPDDFVEYQVYVLDLALRQYELREKLRAVQVAARVLMKSLPNDFVWQRDAFELVLVHENGTSLLRGGTSFGDSVEDEWLVVYLLRELSKQFPDLWIKVTDTDGEFLLIEAANVLPKWLKPEIAENRVWLNEGELAIIPVAQVSGGSRSVNRETHTIKIREAFVYLQNHSALMLRIPTVNAEAFHRLRNYPQQIVDNLHHAMIAIPRSLAHVLDHKAAYVGSAIEAFYLRDPIAKRSLDAVDTLFFPPVDLVKTVVTFNKAGYAQLKGQRFCPPLQWLQMSSLTNLDASENQFTVGIKVTCGFEMLVSDPQNQDKKLVREIKLILDDVNRGEEKLPSDSTIASWKRQEDSESWLDIDFRDFESELTGKGDDPSGSGHGFGDKNAQENLKKMVARFKDFLERDDQGSDSSDNTDTNDDDNDDESGDDNQCATTAQDDGQGNGPNFDEAEFTRMMSELMGVTAADQPNESILSTSAQRSPAVESTPHVNLDSYSQLEDDDIDIRNISQAMEQELKEHGALQLDLHPQTAMQKLSPSHWQDTDARLQHDARDWGEDSTEELEVDLNLAKNLLNSFNEQAGLAGPGGNLMSLMGVQLPRNEDDGDMIRQNP